MQPHGARAGRVRSRQVRVVEGGARHVHPVPMAGKHRQLLGEGQGRGGPAGASVVVYRLYMSNVCVCTTDIQRKYRGAARGASYQLVLEQSS